MLFSHILKLYYITDNRLTKAGLQSQSQSQSVIVEKPDSPIAHSEISLPRLVSNDRSVHDRTDGTPSIMTTLLFELVWNESHIIPQMLVVFTNWIINVPRSHFSQIVVPQLEYLANFILFELRTARGAPPALASPFQLTKSQSIQALSMPLKMTGSPMLIQVGRYGWQGNTTKIESSSFAGAMTCDVWGDANPRHL
jgi:hypothetical protein